MKIGVDAMPLQEELTGTGNYLLRLLEALIPLRPHDDFYLYRTCPSTILHTLSQFNNVHLRTHSFLGFSEALWSQTTLPWLCWHDRLDFFWGTTQSLPLISPRKQKSIITIHDFAYRLYPKMVSRTRGYYLRALSRYFYSKADRRVTNSQGTANRLKELYQLETDLIVQPPCLSPCSAINDSFDTFNLERKNYFLMISTLEPRKNIAATLKAYSEFAAKIKIAPLVLVGKKGWKDSEISQAVSHLEKQGPEIFRWLGYVNATQLRELTREAKAYLMPSVYEGYGMPIAEARSLGTPVICTHSPEMIEAAEKDAFFLKSESFVQDLENALTSDLPKPRACRYPSAGELAARLSTLFDV